MSPTDIVVIGDIMIDRYIEGDTQRISPEAPIPIIEVKEESQSVGGAGHVLMNLLALGCSARIVSVIGQDPNGEALTTLLAPSVATLLRDPMRPTTCKTRIRSRGQQLLRIDNESRIEIDDEKGLQLVNEIKNLRPRYLIVSDYAKGAITPFVLKKLMEYAKSENVKILIDPKGLNWDKYQGAFIIKPNFHEIKEILPQIENEDQSIDQWLPMINRNYGIDHVILTRSSRGISWSDGQSTCHYPVNAASVYDVTGAGDTTIAVIAYMLLKGHPIEESIKAANVAGAYVISKQKTYAISKQELERLIRD